MTLKIDWEPGDEFTAAAANAIATAVNALMGPDAIAAGLEDPAWPLRAALDDLYGAPQVPVNLWWTIGSTVYCQVKNSGPIRLFPFTSSIRALCGATAGKSYCITDDNILTAFGISEDDGFMTNNSITVYGLPVDAVMNGICAGPGGELYVVSSTKIYSGTVDGSNILTLTEFCNLGFDAGTSAVRCAAGNDVSVEDVSSTIAIFSADSDGNVWGSAVSGAVEYLDHESAGIGSCSYMSADPIADPSAGYRMIYASIDGLGIYNFFGGVSVALGDYPSAAYDGYIYAATGSKIVRNKTGQAQKTVTEDVNATLIAVSTS